MFTEKDIERAEKMRQAQKYYVESMAVDYNDDRQAIAYMNQFNLLKLAQLENQIEELRGGK